MLLPLALPPADPGFEMLVSSQGMSQGLPITDGIQFFPRAFVRFGPVQVGGQWRNVDSPSASGVAALFAKYSRDVGKVQIDGIVRYRIRIHHRGQGDRASWEFAATALRAFGRLSLQGTAEFSPNEFGNGESVYVELTPALDVGHQFKVSGSAGRRIRARAPDYSAFNIGLSRAVGRHLTVDGRFHATDRGELGERFRKRLVISARLTL